jgi:HlyD family secretion protein
MHYNEHTNHTATISMKLIISLIIFSILVSCKSKNPLDDLQYYTVHKTKFTSSVTVYGSIESNRMFNYNCPVRGYDITIGYLIPEGTFVNKNDTICRLECSEIENKYLDAVKNFDLAKSEFEKTKAQQELESKILESQVKSIEASTSIAMLDSSRLEFYTPSNRKISELTLQKAKIECDKYKRKIDYMKRINSAVLSKLKLKINQQENNVKRFSKEMNKLKIVADTTGIVQYAVTWSTDAKAKIGDIIWGQSPILNVIDVTSLQVKLLVSESEFKQIQKDNRVEILIDAGDSTIYKGKIISKSPGGKNYTNDKDSKIKYFEILSTIEPKPRNIQPGVSVTCKVYLNELKDTIAIPIMSVFDHDSNKVVFIREITKCRRQVVKTGPASEKEIIITKGLKPNDKITLTEPPESLLR